MHGPPAVFLELSGRGGDISVCACCLLTGTQTDPYGVGLGVLRREALNTPTVLTAKDRVH